MKVAVVAEFYPRANDPVLGIWAHEQARAARAAGADVRSGCISCAHKPPKQRFRRFASTSLP